MAAAWSGKCDCPFGGGAWPQTQARASVHPVSGKRKREPDAGEMDHDVAQILLLSQDR